MLEGILKDELEELEEGECLHLRSQGHPQSFLQGLFSWLEDELLEGELEDEEELGLRLLTL